MAIAIPIYFNRAFSDPAAVADVILPSSKYHSPLNISHINISRLKTYLKTSGGEGHSDFAIANTRKTILGFCVSQE
jgi:hypothetical protein